MCKYPDGDYARPLIDIRFESQRVADAQAMHVKNMLAVVGDERSAVLEPQLRLPT